jgi:nicotinamide riboside kinase
MFTEKFFNANHELFTKLLARSSSPTPTVKWNSKVNNEVKDYDFLYGNETVWQGDGTRHLPEQTRGT